MNRKRRWELYFQVHKGVSRISPVVDFEAEGWTCNSFLVKNDEPALKMIKEMRVSETGDDRDAKVIDHLSKFTCPRGGYIEITTKKTDKGRTNREGNITCEGFAVWED